MSVFILPFICAVAASPSELVDAYVRSSRVLDDIEWKISYKEVLDSPTRLDGVTLRDGTYVVRHGGTRWKIEHQGVVRSISGTNQLEVNEDRYEFIMNDEFPHLQVHKGADGQIDHVVGELKSPREDASVGTLDYFMLLFGFVYGNDQQPYGDVLRESELTASEETIDGRRLQKLESVGRFGRGTAWFDPGKNMQLVKLSQIKGPGDLMNRRRVSDIPARTSDEHGPGGKIVGFEKSLDVSRFTAVGGEFIPAAGVIAASTSFEGGARSTIRYSFVVEQIRKGVQDSDFEVTSAIPDGFTVSVRDAPKIGYEWRKGALVKRVDAGAMRNLGSGRFGSTASLIGYFVVFAVLLVVVAYGMTWAYRRQVG